LHFLEYRVRGGHRAVQGELKLQSCRVQVPFHVATGKQRRQAGGKAQALAVPGQVEGLDAEAVAGQEQGVPVLVPEGEGKHAVEAFQAGFAPGVIGLQDDFRIPVGKEAVAHAAQFPAQFPVVIYGAVENQGQLQLRIVHGLVRAFGEVDDRQAPVPKGHGAVGETAAVVRAAPLHGIHHPAQGGQVGCLSIETQFSTNAAHVQFQ